MLYDAEGNENFQAEKLAEQKKLGKDKGKKQKKKWFRILVSKIKSLIFCWKLHPWSYLFPYLLLPLIYLINSLSFRLFLVNSFYFIIGSFRLFYNLIKLPHNCFFLLQDLPFIAILFFQCLQFSFYILEFLLVCLQLC